MNSSNKQLHNLACAIGARTDPGFKLVVAFDYYDGPEKGFALYPSGAGVRFSSLGDSQSRLFRAFELVAIEGDWWPQIRALKEETAVGSSSRMLVPSASEALTLLEDNVFDVAAGDYFVGIGSPNLDWLAITMVSLEQLKVLRSSPVGFRLTHQTLKRNYKLKGSASD